MLRRLQENFGLEEVSSTNPAQPTFYQTNKLQSMPKIVIKENRTPDLENMNLALDHRTKKQVVLTGVTLYYISLS